MMFENQMVDILVKKLEGREQEFLEAYNSSKVPEWSNLGLKEVYPDCLLKLMGMSEYKLIPYLKLEPLVIAARKKILEKMDSEEYDEELDDCGTCAYLATPFNDMPCKDCYNLGYWEPKVDNGWRYHKDCKFYLVNEQDEPCKTCFKDETKPNWTPKNHSVEVCL